MLQEQLKNEVGMVVPKNTQIRFVGIINNIIPKY